MVQTSKPNTRIPFSKNPIVLAILTIIFWSFGASFLKMMLHTNHQFALNVSFLCGSITFFVIAYFEYGGLRQIWNVIITFKWNYWFYGLFGYFFYYFCYDQSFKAFNNNISEPLIFNYTWPMFTFLFVTIFINKLKCNVTFFIEITGLLISLSGVWYLATKGHPMTFDFINANGVLWGLLTGISYGIFSTLSYKIKSQNITAFLLIAIFTSFIANIFSTLSFKKYSIVEISNNDLIWAMMHGVFISGLGYFLWGKAKSYANEFNINVSPVLSLTFYLPLFSSILLSLFFKEVSTLQIYFWISLILVFVGNLTVNSAEYINSKFFRINNNKSTS